VPGAVSRWRSTSAIAQYHAALQGRALAILPCFMASPDARLVPVLPEEIVVTRAFFLSCREDLRRLRRITAVWDYLRAAAELNHAFLMGDAPEIGWVDIKSS
jgi:DNA-binding transcriptional LysR family regulator